MLFFDEDSNDRNVRRTLREARQIRKSLREADAERLATKQFVTAGREVSETRSTISGREN
jgi:hypothetical protein